ncbi:MAG: DUF2393 family protein [Acidobacteriaceae bacterium]
MNDTKPKPDAAQESPLFQAPESESTGGGMPIAVWVIAVLVVVLGIAALAVFGGHKDAAPKVADATVQAPLDAYASSLPISGIQMSQTNDFGGGALTYIDGHIHNTGQETVSGITVQAIFRNDIGEPPQVVTMPLMLIRTRQPYVDTQSVWAAPLKPGDDREFRLIFEHVTPNWNQQYPEVHVIRVEAK